MDRPDRTWSSRLPTLAWAATVLALLVLPPALSAGQDAADPTTDPPPAQLVPPDSPATPPQEGQQGGPGAGSSGGQDGGQPAEPEAPQPASTAVSSDASAAPIQKSKAKAAGSLTVSIGDNFYSPASVTVNAGDTITWRNNGVAQHSATADDGSFDTGVFGPGASRSVTFSDPGTFNYFCTVHGQSQSGTVTVASTGGGGGGGSGPSEAAAVSSDGAAGSSSALPSTGSNTLPPMVVGLLLLLAGLALRYRNWFGPA